MAPLLKIAALLNLSLYVAAQGTQFITGACTADADCASACCGFNSGKCAGPVVAQQRDGGCGFGNPQPNADAAIALGFTGAAPSAAAAAAPAASSAAAGSGTTTGSGATGAGNGAGKQFITGPCNSDADCANSCCGFNSGKCAGAIVAQERDGGCGHGDAQPNDIAAQALRGQRMGKRGVALYRNDVN
ncbi:hypothetical protein K491DRAFT_676534 [Lophiostoma macrostomum CBS 122681]|uniref:Biotrophy-associated secreted protein 2 n=1 Tax=Lophiostoma macrostomum CBS 122681 TaxID=1314788 RepID=A0A6A6TE56_9PLEO|nr:hypothetical protein K491DRAFT_676534 [Lophiostoma macrostomum CBS 122681]